MRNRLIHTIARVAGLCLVAIALTFLVPPAAMGQNAISAEGAAAVKTAFIADLDVMKDKFIGLANAFPADKYTWRPMEGVRSVSEVLMLVTMEGYSFVPQSFGGAAAQIGGPEEMAKLRNLTDKAQIIDHLTKAFAHAKQTLQGIDPSTLTGTRRVMGSARSTPDIAFAIGGDLHEHLGQLIAYARTNHVVPPWSK
jgi:hypothetical protein